MLDCVGLRMVFCADEVREKTKHHMSTVMFFRGDSDPFYLLDNQGHCDTVLSKTFFKAFQFCGLKPFYKYHL